MKLGIIGAMDSEISALAESLHNMKATRHLNMIFYEGDIEGSRLVVVKSGIGKVSMAVCAQALIDLYGVDHLINTGVAGSLTHEVSIGDIVVATDCVHHDLDVCNLGYTPGQVPNYPFSFIADKRMSAIISDVCVRLAPEAEVFNGRIASGDQFIASPDDKSRINGVFGALCAEMEGAALAQTAWLNQIPFSIVRIMSDSADGSAPTDYRIFEAQAANRLAKLMAEATPLIYVELEKEGE